MEINTERLLIVPCTLENYYKLSNQYDTGPHIEMYLEQLKRDSSVEGWGGWFVILRENNQVIGDIGFKGKPNDQKTVEIGYGIIPTAQNQGFATEAVQGLIDWAFSSGQVEKVIAECLEDNVASIRVLEKVRMERTSAKGEMLYWELEKPFK
ncbi:GNAT family N-acetyltransferase [Thermaerobacillus caldiproteolyticus]|uniref:Ribosomal-protein-alanine N-acetyltransferase n=1 Tax=Thermaerobacillus caldiproteolyticus TaxID=247480 RepID=A0A7W0C0Z6_9BACL|nr:GNAT family N-acetyltransferase [Anoxybacillus caldiproteolyticus]MBA2876611.1 ribosomal-protein-alanine N-acetyltransferase [Anoxybacillus caldiproteolyticus]